MLSALQIRDRAGQVFNARVGTIFDPMCKLIYETSTGLQSKPYECS
jgi:hypothetical protein